jgi:hypothetical protein
MKTLQGIIGLFVIAAFIVFLVTLVLGFRTVPQDFEGAGNCTAYGDCY